MRRHTGEKPYKCPHCSLKFTYQASLKRHFDKSACGQKVL
ncbi:UNVERIFIED_CONTAM: hypothetical protein GTU68_055943 [Idotea baltica]|nr:hypothetical protein [Idotea baltica]